MSEAASAVEVARQVNVGKALDLRIGGAWTIVKAPSGGGKFTWSVSATSPKDVWIAGNGAFLQQFDGNKLTYAEPERFFDGHFHVYPRVLGDVREYDTSGEEQWRVLPSLRLDYRFGRHVTFELESGYEWTSRDMGEAQFDSEGYYVRFGYRSNF